MDNQFNYDSHRVVASCMVLVVVYYAEINNLLPTIPNDRRLITNLD